MNWGNLQRFAPPESANGSPWLGSWGDWGSNSDMADAETQIGLQPGDRLNGRYELVRIIGAGGMGQVWLANDANLDQEVALKVLPQALGRDARAVGRLKEEAKANQRLTHENIVRLHNFEIDESRGNTAFLVMEYVDGETGDQLLAEHPKGLPVDLVVAMIRQIARAVDYAHGRKVLHRDIKPHNIMRCRRDRKMKLLDFGIANEARESMTRVTGKALGDGSGTLVYMSPQQLLGRDGKGNDIYSLAATAYELLSGRPPFSGSGDVSLQIREVMPRPLPNVPDHVNAALMAGLAKRTRERPATAGDFARMLEAGSAAGRDSASSSRGTQAEAVAADLSSEGRLQVLDVEQWWYRTPELKLFGPYNDQEFSDLVVAGHILPLGFLRRCRHYDPDEGKAWVRIDEHDVWYWPEDGLVQGIWAPDQWDRLVADGQIGPGWYRRSDMFLEDGKAGWYSVEVAEGGDAAETSDQGPAIPRARQDQFRWMAIVFMGFVFLWMIWPSESWLSWGWRLFWASGFLAIGCWSTFFFTDDFEVDTPAESILKWVGILSSTLAGLVLLGKMVLPSGGPPAAPQSQQSSSAIGHSGEEESGLGIAGAGSSTESTQEWHESVSDTGIQLGVKASPSLGLSIAVGSMPPEVERDYDPYSVSMGYEVRSAQSAVLCGTWRDGRPVAVAAPIAHRVIQVLVPGYLWESGLDPLSLRAEGGEDVYAPVGWFLEVSPRVPGGSCSELSYLGRTNTISANGEPAFRPPPIEYSALGRVVVLYVIPKHDRVTRVSAADVVVWTGNL